MDVVDRAFAAIGFEPTLMWRDWVGAEKHGISLTLRYLCRPRDRRASTSEMWEKIFDAIASMPDVDIAYPTTRFFEHATEGKTLATPSDPSASTERSGA